MWEAIRSLRVRGAPAIGIAAAMGLVLGVRDVEAAGPDDFMGEVERVAEYLETSRPTAVNLFWALDRMKDCGRRFVSENPDASVDKFCNALLDEANAICREDKEMCKAIGVNGEKFIKEGTGILTHCNAGALATINWGTARESPSSPRARSSTPRSCRIRSSSSPRGAHPSRSAWGKARLP